MGKAYILLQCTLVLSINSYVVPSSTSERYSNVTSDGELEESQFRQAVVSIIFTDTEYRF